MSEEIYDIAESLYEESLYAKDYIKKLNIVALNLQIQAAYVENKTLMQVIVDFKGDVATLEGAAVQIGEVNKQIMLEPTIKLIEQLKGMSIQGYEFMSLMNLVCLNLQIMCSKIDHPSANAINVVVPELSNHISHLQESIKKEIKGADSMVEIIKNNLNEEKPNVKKLVKNSSK